MNGGPFDRAMKDRFPIVTVVVSVHKTTFDDQTIHPVGCSVKIKYRSRKRLMERRVALVTGGNSKANHICLKENAVTICPGKHVYTFDIIGPLVVGIGLTICERLLTLHNDLELCLLCRNVTKAEAAKNALLISHPNSTISIIVMDTSDVKSVFKAAKILKERYKRIDFLYLNAGIMPVTGVNWSNVVKGILSTKCAHVLSTGEGCLYHTDQVTKDGLKNIFASNVFGHYALIKEMEERLGGEKDTQIIWTSSRAAMLSSFDINDIQHRHGDNPYASSKYIIDIVSVSLNDNLNKKNVYSHTTCPGLVMTNLTNGILPNWVWNMLYPILMILRIFCCSLNCSAYNGSEAMVWLSTQKPSTLDPRVKFNSNADMFGKSYMDTVKLGIDIETEDKVTNKLDQLYQGFKDKYS